MFVKATKSSARSHNGRLISVEGCIGVGKSTWAKELARVRQAQLVLEDFEKNPFLRAFYDDPRGNALETELHFLLIHYHQLKGIQSQNASETITDFTFFKDRIFAELNLLGASETDVFDHLYENLVVHLRPADLVIYLRGSDDLILNRIRERNRSVEMKIDADYFVKLNRAYEIYFAQHRGAVLVVEADRADCVKNPGVVLDVSQAIDDALASSGPP